VVLDDLERDLPIPGDGGSTRASATAGRARGSVTLVPRMHVQRVSAGAARLDHVGTFLHAHELLPGLRLSFSAGVETGVVGDPHRASAATR
jgi:hypothetical protein